MLSLEAYLKDPCRASSLPYWKANGLSIPDGMKILHQDDFNGAEHADFIDEPYFRLRHDLRSLLPPRLPQGYSLRDASLGEFAAHINQCYHDVGVSETELRDYTSRPVYVPSLWLAVRSDATGDLAATGIAELDPQCHEGILEWVQVSQPHRGRGLGRYLVTELLWRMKDTAHFATVSGQRHNPTDPEALYRQCGFTGHDVWHILRKRV